MEQVKKVKMKHFMIPVAAFALTVGTASAFSTVDLTQHLGLELSEEQLKALEEAREVREDAREEAVAILEAAGLDESKMREVHDAMREARRVQQGNVEGAIAANDYAAFLAAIEGTPVAAVIDTKPEFERFVEAHELIKAGDREAASVIMNELGLRGSGYGYGMMGDGHHGRGGGRYGQSFRFGEWQ